MAICATERWDSYGNILYVWKVLIGRIEGDECRKDGQGSQPNQEV